jgi:drug/metabolite transporter (DMT)-like permease
MSSSDQALAANLSRGYLFAFASALVLSTTAIFIRYLTQTYQIPALILASWRDLFVALTLFPILAVFKPSLLKVSSKHLRYLFGYGLLLAIFNALWTLSVALNGAAISTVLAYCSAGFTALLGWWFLKERLDWGKILAVLLTLSGCVLVSEALDVNAWLSNVLGIITGILSGLAYAIYTLMGRKASQDGINPWTTLLYIFSFAAILLFLTNLILGSILPGGAVHFSDMLWLGNQTKGWMILFLLASGPTLVGFGLYNLSLVDLPSSVANLVVTLEPVFTTVIAFYLLNERMNLIQLIGSFLILGGVIFLRLHERRIKFQKIQYTLLTKK